MRRPSRKVVIVAATALLLFGYAGSYFVRSVRGRYEPADIGGNGVKRYLWAPDGFVTDFIWHERIERVYYPLWIFDIRMWHTSDKAYSELYPINEVAQKDIEKVSRAWK